MEQSNTPRADALRREYVWLLGLLLLGLALRVYRIDHQSLWFDEAIFYVASQVPLNEITGEVVRGPTHPPLGFLALHAWFRWLGTGSLQARLFGAVVGTLAILPVYFLARYCFDFETARLSAFLLAVSQHAIMLSQEVRPYALLLLLSASSTFLFAMSLLTRSRLAWWACTISLVATAYVAYYGAFLAMSFILYGWFQRKRLPVPGFWWLASGIVFVALYLPWIVTGFIDQTLYWRQVLTGEQPPWFQVHWTIIASTINTFNNGKPNGLLESAPLWAFLLGCLLFILPAMFAMARTLVREPQTDRDQDLAKAKLLMMSTVWAVPVALVLMVGALGLPYDVRHVSFCIAPYYILVAHGIAQISPRHLRQTIVVTVAIYSVYALRSNYFIPYKENHRDALAELAGKYQAGDCCLFSPFGGVPLQWSIYRYQPEASGLRVLAPDAAPSNLLECERVWLVSYSRTSPAAIKGVELEGKLARTYRKVEEKGYHWVKLALFARAKGQVQTLGAH